MNFLDKAIYAILLSFFVGVILCPVIIPVLHRMKFGQTVRDDGPQSHLKKNGTPTMGGIVILISLLIGSSIFLKDNPDGIVVLLTTLSFGAVGFLDDYIKVVKKRSLGLRAYQKFSLQFLICGLFCAYMMKNGHLGTEIIIPFINTKINLGLLYVPFLFFVMLGTVNGVNLTDGLDGLASGVTLLISGFFLIGAWFYGSGITPISGAVIGSLLSFLIFNAYPAKVFMGDTGSLALGGFVAATALILKMPLFIPIVGFIYLIESISVIIQVGVYKLTKKRVFKMAPIHHHFEQCGMDETKIVTLFYIITAVLCLVGFLSFN